MLRLFFSGGGEVFQLIPAVSVRRPKGSKIKGSGFRAYKGLPGP